MYISNMYLVQSLFYEDVVKTTHICFQSSVLTLKCFTFTAMSSHSLVVTHFTLDQLETD